VLQSVGTQRLLELKLAMTEEYQILINVILLVMETSLVGIALEDHPQLLLLVTLFVETDMSLGLKLVTTEIKQTEWVVIQLVMELLQAILVQPEVL